MLVRIIKQKLRVVFNLVMDVIRFFPRRWRLLKSNFEDSNSSTVRAWRMISLIGLGELYEITMEILKPNIRGLSQEEIILIRQVFGSSLDYKKVRIDNKAILGSWTNGFCYVSLNTINCWGKMSDEVFIHELVHIWQYQKWGIAYIPRALRAQKSTLKYDYGGVSNLKLIKSNGGGIMALNYEQMADMVMDYFLILIGKKPQWGDGKLVDIAEYEYFVDMLRYDLVL